MTSPEVLPAREAGCRHDSDSAAYIGARDRCRLTSSSSSSSAAAVVDHRRSVSISTTSSSRRNSTWLTSLRRQFGVAQWYVKSNVYEMVRGEPYSLVKLTVGGHLLLVTVGRCRSLQVTCCWSL